MMACRQPSPTHAIPRAPGAAPCCSFEALFVMPLFRRALLLLAVLCLLEAPHL